MVNSSGYCYFETIDEWKLVTTSAIYTPGEGYDKCHSCGGELMLVDDTNSTIDGVRQRCMYPKSSSCLY